MKIVFAVVLALIIAAPAYAFTAPVGIPNENGCGMGAFVLARTGAQQDRHLPPLFVTGSRPIFDTDGDDGTGHGGEGRSDTFYMTRLEACVAAK